MKNLFKGMAFSAIALSMALCMTACSDDDDDDNYRPDYGEATSADLTVVGYFNEEMVRYLNITGTYMDKGELKTAYIAENTVPVEIDGRMRDMYPLVANISNATLPVTLDMRITYVPKNNTLRPEHQVSFIMADQKKATVYFKNGKSYDRTSVLDVEKYNDVKSSNFDSYVSKLNRDENDIDFSVERDGSIDF